MKELLNQISNLNNVIIISSLSVQQAIKEEIYKNKLLLNIQYKTYTDVVKDFYGYYSKEAYTNLVLEESINPEIANILLDNTFYVSGGYYQNNKINQLSKLKEKFSSYLVKDDFVIRSYYNKEIIIVNPNYTNILFVNLLDQLHSISNVRTLNLSEKFKKDLRVYYFNNLKEEVEALAYEVSKLIYQGISPDKIKIHSLNDNYLPVIHEVFNFYNISIDFSSDKTLYEYDIVKSFFNFLLTKTNENFKECLPIILDELKEKIKINNFRLTKILNKMIDVLNHYTFYDGSVGDIYNVILYDFKNTRIKFDQYLNVIKIVDVIDDYIKPDDYVFFLGFNQDILPQIIRDEDYLLDQEKKELGFKTTTFINKQIKSNLKRAIASSRTIYLSYSLNSLDSKLQRSSYIDVLKNDYNLEEVSYKKSILLSYSQSRDYFSLAKMLDQYYLYDVKSDELFILYHNLSDVKYLKYSNSFTGIDQSVLDNYLEKELNLSYTSIESFNNCSFKYYLERVLKVKRNANLRHLMIGNYFHEVLEKLISENKDDINEHLELLTNEFISNNNLTLSPKDNFYFEIYQDHLKRIFEIIKLQYNRSKFKVHSLEANFKFPLSYSKNSTISGKIDKVLVCEINGQNYAIIMDYKTGRNNFDYNKVPYGLDLQTLIYFYLFKKSFNEYLFAGAYLQSLFPSNPFLHNTDASYDEQLKDYLQWNGYTIKDFGVIKYIDPFYNNDGFLKSIKQKKDLDFHANSLNKVLTLDEFAKLEKMVEKKIYECVNYILEGEFIINPKKAQNVDSCEYCNYKDICFKKEKDYLRIEISNNLDFIRKEGENSDSN